MEMLFRLEDNVLAWERFSVIRNYISYANNTQQLAEHCEALARVPARTDNANYKLFTVYVCVRTCVSLPPLPLQPCSRSLTPSLSNGATSECIELITSNVIRANIVSFCKLTKALHEANSQYIIFTL